MNKTLANFLGLKPAAAVVVVNGDLSGGAPTPQTPDPEPTAEDTAPEPDPETPTPEPVTDAPAPDASLATGAETMSISATELATLQAAATELAEIKPKYEILSAWYQNVKGEGATPGADASAANATARKSWQDAPWNN